MVEGEDAEEINEEMNTQPSIVPRCRNEAIARRKHHVPRRKDRTAEEVNEKINANSPCRQEAEATMIASKKHHYPRVNDNRSDYKSSSQNDARHQDTLGKRLNQNRIPKVQ